MENLITIIHVVVSLSVIGLVLVQHGKGADAGAAFGGNSSGSVFGAQGSGNFVTRLTAICVTIFFCTSIGLAFIASNKNASSAADQIPENSSQSVETNEQLNESEGIDNTQDIPN
ncbi:MAG: preprotein translocase subunit SecG [Nitrosomonadales bacterium]|nr:preprotein translocase subunit SecG [Nitrosomonadales bacterium]MCH9771110.1 preprotein translocase subunit SecG [Betaproteobacteria bacterium]